MLGLDFPVHCWKKVTYQHQEGNSIQTKNHKNGFFVGVKQLLTTIGRKVLLFWSGLMTEVSNEESRALVTCNDIQHRAIIHGQNMHF